MTNVGMDNLSGGVERVIEDANNAPECFKCQRPITELNQVRTVTVRIDGKPVSVWVHADHSKPNV